MRKNRKERRRWIGLTVLVIAILIPLAAFAISRIPAPRVLRYGEFKQLLRKPGNHFSKLKIAPTEIRGEMTEGSAPAPVDFRTSRIGLENDPELQSLLDQRVGGAYQAADEESAASRAVSVGGPILGIAALLAAVLVGLHWYGGGSSPLAVGRSRHKLYARNDLPVGFDDVAGIDEAVAELNEVVDFLRQPDKYRVLGGRIPKGVLLVGPPGTGKTLLARAVAGEAGVPFFNISGSDFVEMYVGVGAARVRDLFARAQRQAPCIVFIDELDALGKARAGNVPGSHDEREQTLNQLLVEMDGFDADRGVIIMAATNRPETLDAALTRPGRFDRTVVVDRPDVAGREAILGVHVRKVRMGGGVDLRHVAGLTSGFAGADLANLVNEAALMAARGGKEAVGMADFEEAIERGAVGLQRKARVMQEVERKRVAYHEAGHALVASTDAAATPVHKVSIIPRGMALGYVLRRPEDDRYLMTRSELEARIRVALGGTLAEEIVLGEISNGATSDLQEASRVARSMVTEFGMSRLGRIHYKAQRQAFLPNSPAEEDGGCSEQTAREIDVEVRSIIDDASRVVRQTLQARRAALDAVACRLLKKEVIDGEELRRLLNEYPAAPEDTLNHDAVVDARITEPVGE